MILKIKIGSKDISLTGIHDALIPLGNNPCLPEIIAKTFSYDTITIEVVDNKGYTIRISACLFGKKIVLLPHFSYGPIIPPDIVSEIIEGVKAQGYHCEWRLTNQVSEFCVTSKVTTFIRLARDAQSQFAVFDSNLRRKIRKCSSNGITIKKGGHELLEDFYLVYSRRMHQLGSPVLPQRWFNNLLQEYSGGEASIWCAYQDKVPMGTAFVLEYQGFYEACWFATLRQYNKFYISYGLIWEMLRHAITQSGKTFSLGRSTLGSSVHRYKQQWGGEDAALYWNHSHHPGKSLRSFSFVSQLWKLVPYSLTLKLGPWLAGKVY